MNHTPIAGTLADVLWPRYDGYLRKISLAILGSLALFISAKIHIPFYPVPFTLQTLVVLMIGMVFGWRLGAATILLYLAEGAVGLPVFSGTPERGIGIAYLLGPTGGYLLGFVLAAGLAGWLAERGWDRNILKTALAILLGNIVIYMPGLLWLGAVIGWDKPVLELGLYPFVIGDLVKLSIAAMLLPTIWKFVGANKT